MRRLKSFWLAKKAIAAIEFAILAPVFFLIFFGIIEVGITMFVDSTLNTSIRAASRAGIAKGFKDQEEFRSVMKNYMGGLYREDGQGMNLSAQIVNCGAGTDLASISASIENDSFFEKGFNIKNCKQTSAMVVYGARYNWGGFTGFMKPFLPEHLYAITVVRNEPF